MNAAKAIELFYLFFQGVIIFQVLIFFVLYWITRKNDILYYTLFLFFAAAYFFLNAPYTFFGISEDAVFESRFYEYMNIPLVIAENYFYLLFLQSFYNGLTYDKLVLKTLRYTLLIIPALILLFVIVKITGNDTQGVFYTVKLLAVIPAIVICFMFWNKKLPFFNLMLSGLTCTIAGTLLTVCMIILRNAGFHHLFTDGYPLFFIRLGLLGDMVFYLVAILQKWNFQEKQLAMLQMQKQLEISNLRNTISSQLHDDIGSELSGVSMYCHLANTQLNEGAYGKVNDSLQTIRHSANEVIGKLDDLVWSVKSEHIILKKLVEKLLQYGQDMCFARSVEFRTNLYNFPDDIEFSEKQNYHLYLCLKEAINNAVKYSEATVIELSFEKSAIGFRFSVSDNGKGMADEISHTGNGIKNMRQRAENIGALFALESSPGKGLSVKLDLRIPQ